MGQDAAGLLGIVKRRPAKDCPMCVSALAGKLGSINHPCGDQPDRETTMPNLLDAVLAAAKTCLEMKFHGSLLSY
jgi:hypothetical protein